MGMIYSDFQAFFGVGFEAFGPEEELLQQICENVEAIFLSWDCFKNWQNMDGELALLGGML